MIKVLGFVPARKGSKGVKNKNIREINHKPLIEYTFEEIKKSKKITDFILSTDSERIFEISKKYNPISHGLRPSYLADDTALTIDVIKYEINKLGSNIKQYTHLMLLQPTCPLRSSKHIDESIQKLYISNARSLISVVQINSYHPLRMKKIYNDKLVNYIDTGYENMEPRQNLPKVYIRNGAIYLARIEDIISHSSLSTPDCVPFEMSEYDSINIDSEVDFKLAQYYLNSENIN